MRIDSKFQLTFKCIYNYNLNNIIYKIDISNTLLFGEDSILYETKGTVRLSAFSFRGESGNRIFIEK